MTSAFYRQMEEGDRLKRWLATAATWSAKVTALVRHGGHDRFADYWIDDYVYRALSELADLLEGRPAAEPRPFDEVFAAVPGIGWLDGYRFEKSVEAAERILAALRAVERRGDVDALIEKLENVEGRSPEEAALFLAKAAELRAGRR